MNAYTIDLSNGCRAMVDANTEDEARAFAIEQCTFPGEAPPQVTHVQTVTHDEVTP